MRCKCPLDSLLCRVDKHFLHSYDSYHSTTITRSPLPTRQARKFLSLLNEMQMSTWQFTLSTRIMSTVLDNSPPPPGGVAVMQFFSKNRANFVKITAILKWLVHELSLLSWTSRPLFAHFISFSKGVYLILPLKRFGIFKRFIVSV